MHTQFSISCSLLSVLDLLKETKNSLSCSLCGAGCMFVDCALHLCLVSCPDTVIEKSMSRVLNTELPMLYHYCNIFLELCC